MTNTEHCLSVRFDLIVLVVVAMLTNPFVREECNILDSRPLVFKAGFAHAGLHQSMTSINNS